MNLVATMAGRDAAMARLVTAVGAGQAGNAQVLSVTGAPGSGKTTLINAIAGQTGPDALVLRATGHPEETELPYAGLHQLLRPVADRLDNTLRAALAIHPTQPGDQMAVAAALFSLLSSVAADQFAVVLIDDVQWIDAASRRALTFSARRLDRDAVTIIVAGLPGSEPSVGGSSIALGPIDDRSAAAILYARHSALHSTVARRIVDAAEGLPLALVEIAASLSEQQRRGSAPLPDILPVGPAIHRLYAPRLDQLPDASLHALVIAAIGPGSAAALLANLEAAGCSTDDLDAAERLGLISFADGRWTFSHPTVCAAVLERAAAPLVRATHRLLALRSQGPRRAWHLHRAATAPDPAVAEALVAAAEHARSRGALVEAAERWIASSTHAPDDATRYAAIEQAAECLLDVGMSVRAAGLLDELIDSAPDDVTRLRWEGRRVGLDLWRWQPEAMEARALIARAAPLADGPSRGIAAQVLLTVAAASLARGDNAPDGLFALLRRLGGRRAQSVVLVEDALDGSSDALTTLAGPWIDTLPPPRSLGEATGIILAGSTLLWLDRIDACERLVERLEAFDVPPLSGLRAVARQLCALCALRRGDWQRADLELAVAQGIAVDGDLAMIETSNRLHQTLLALGRGEQTLATHLLDSAAHDDPAGIPWMRFGTLLVRARLCALRGEFAAALTAYEFAEEIELRHQFAAPSMNEGLHDHVAILVRLGRTGEARAVVDRYETLAEIYRTPTTLGAVAFERGRLDGDPAAFDRALEHFGAAVNYFSAARCLLVKGETLRRQRRRKAAVADLTRSQAMFAAIDAGPWQRRAQAELEACGVRRVVDPSSPTLAGLTPREYEIARTVAAGFTNAQTAQRLFISVRTVGYHLANTYQKLGIRGREELKRFF